MPNPVKSHAGTLGARRRSGDRPGVVHLAALTSPQRRVILALVAAAKAELDSSNREDTRATEDSRAAIKKDVGSGRARASTRGDPFALVDGLPRPRRVERLETRPAKADFPIPLLAPISAPRPAAVDGRPEPCGLNRDGDLR
jgi:hypothetical protein